MTTDDEPAYRPDSLGPTTPKPIKWETGGRRSRAISTSRRNEAGTGSPSASTTTPHRANSMAGSMSDFNLRDSVMSSLAKSIGLIQPPRPPPASSFNNSHFPPLSGSVSMASSPPLSAQRSAMFNSSFGPLSMLQRSMGGGMGGGDDETSSMATGVSSGWGAANGDGQEELENEVEILFFPKGELIVREGEKNAGLFFVIDGFLEVSIPPPNRPKPASHSKPSATSKTSKPTPFTDKKNAKPTTSAVPPKRPPPTKSTNFDPPPPVAPGSTHLYTVKPGGIAGYLSALSDSASYVDLRAKTDIYVGFLPSEALNRLLERRPIVLLTLAKRLISLLSPLVLHIDASLDWMQLNAGQVLYRQGDPSDSIYIVINGRLRALQETEAGGAVETVAEHGQGESVGELDVITTSPRSNTVHAIRDTELARMPITLFNAISIRHPATTIKFLRLIASRVTKEVDDRKQRRPASSGAASGGIEATPSNLNLKTVAILPSSRNVPVAAFATKLRGALEDLGSPTAYLDQATVMRHLGRHTFSTMGKLKVAGWLAEQEQKYKMVLYVADTAVSSQWTVTCIRQADYIMVVGMGDDPSIGEYEKLLLASKTTARKELVLLHPDRNVPSGSTRPWLKERPWISQHLHLELPGLVLPPKSTPVIYDPAAVVAFKHLREKVQTQMKKFKALRPIGHARAPPHLDDFARLARRLCGVSIGVVLGGGGGKGISHLGFLQAMEDEGLPIDMVGGCSIGAFIGGLYAKDANLLATTGRTKQFSGRMANVWRLLSDVTFPTVSYTTGHEFNRGIYKAFNDVHLEDLWLPFFCNSTSLNYNRMEVHTTGYAWRAVRASMTLAGLLPPLSENGNMLVDGGYISNLPCVEMSAMGASRIFAVDVGGIDDSSLRNYGDSVSGFWILLNKFNPWYRPNSGPLTLTEVTGRLTYISSIKTLDEAKVMPGVLYQAMPIQSYDTLGSFGKFDEILKIGLDAATKQIATWKAEGKLPTGVLEGHAVSGRRAKNSIRLRRNSI